MDNLLMGGGGVGGCGWMRCPRCRLGVCVEVFSCENRSQH